MLGLCDPGITIWLSRLTGGTRKHAHSLELVEIGGVLVGVNTGHPNKLIAEAIAGGAIPELGGYDTLRREVAYGEASRIDILLERTGGQRCYVEVKNVHMSRQPGLAEFPDCVTARGAKHLHELSEMVRQGHRAAMVFCVQRGDAERFDLAADIDPVYAHTFDKAVSAGVEALCYSCEVTLDGLNISHNIPIVRTSSQKKK
jgi:sugar fermentation stimulation protein A